MRENEKENLNEISARSLYSDGVMVSAIDYCYRILSRHLRTGSILEMGPAEGVMTERLARLSSSLTLLEGSRIFSESLSLRFPRALVVNELFEDYSPVGRFDNIVMGHVLEHVADPVDVLMKARSWLSPRGIVFAAVPNCRSLHRQAAVIMGLLSAEDALNDRDRHHGHRRVFSPESFRNSFLKAGFTLEAFGGYWLKPVSNMQIETSWSNEMIDAFLQLGERYPDVAGEIYVVASAG